MANAEKLITDHLPLWSSTLKVKKTVGRGSNKKRELYGVKKLRELILELAVRGLLVPQDPNDEPAEMLLEKIAEEKQRLIEKGKIKKQKKLPPIAKEDFPFPKPKGWEFIRLGELTAKLGSGSTPKGGRNAYVPEGVIFLRSQNVWNEGLKLGDTAYIPENIHSNMHNTQVQPNDVLLNITGASLGRSTIFPKHLITANVSQHVTIIRLIETEMCKFLHLGIRSPLVQKLVWGRQVGMAIEGLSKKVLEQFEFPIPPLAEQHRIVAKVDELMALCDALEARQEDSLDTHETLVKTLLDTLTTAADPATFQQAWQRIQSHFHLLFTTESSIDHLKQTILQLAVMGKLVQQDQNDEPASELLKKIAEEKRRLIEEKKIKKQKALPPTPKREKPFGLPNEWKWVRPNDFALKITDGEHFKPPTTERGIYFLSAKDVRDEGISLSAPLYISEETAEKALLRCNPEFDDILIVSRGATVGRICKVNIKDTFCLLGSVILIKPTALVSSEYLTIGFKSPWVLKQLVNASGSTAQPAIYLRDLKKIEFPLPPLVEQHRIVAKVDELMTLCDTLKAKLHSSQETQLHLTDTLAQNVSQ